VVLAAAPAPEHKPALEPTSDDAGLSSPALDRAALLHQASLKTGTREAPVTPVAAPPRQATRAKSTDQPVAAAISAPKKSVDKPGLAAAKPMTKQVHLAKTDPLAPLPDKRVRKSAKDNVSGQ